MIEQLAEQLVEQLLALPDEPARRAFLETHAHSLTEGDASELADALKAQADHYLRAELAPCWQFTRLLFYLAELRCDEFIRALALRAEGNVLSIGQAHFQEAIEKYDEAAAIYRAAGRELDEAKSQIGTVFALTNLGRYDEAIGVGEWVASRQRKHAAFLALATTLMNLGITHHRQGNEKKSLECYEEALTLYGSDHFAEQATLLRNRSEVLRDLGRLAESLLDAETALAYFERTDQPAIAASTLRTIAETCFLMGRYNDSIGSLERARAIFSQDNRGEDIAITDWLISDTLLVMHKYRAAAQKCRHAVQTFLSRGEIFEAGQTLLNEAAAYLGLKEYQESLNRLKQARDLFLEKGNEVWAAISDLHMAQVLNQIGRYKEAHAIATHISQLFRRNSMPARLAQAQLVAAEALAYEEPEKSDLARKQTLFVLELANQHGLPLLSYSAEMHLAKLAGKQQAFHESLEWLNAAIANYEQLRGNWMIEHRTDFAQDKQTPYTNAAEICLARGDAMQALNYLERAKSRALIDMLAYRVDLSVLPRTHEDEPLTQQLNDLLAQRNQLARRLEVEGRQTRLHSTQDPTTQANHSQKLHQLEQDITDQWHSLLVRNANYARDASLWQVQVEPVREQLHPDQALVEYAELNGNWVAFVATPQAVTAHTLPITPAQTQTLLRNLWLNFKTVASSPQTSSHAPALQANAKELLRRLHTGLVQPLHPALAAAQHVFVVPHGALHYLPFQALFDGERGAFWVESSPYTLSYLPCASILKYCRQKPLPFRGGVGEGSALRPIAFGHSRHGHLPHAPHEAQHIAQTLGGLAFTEAEATLSRFQERASTANVIHLAMHGDFRADAPLFSGLHFEDGMLTALDTYNLRLNASLVALSACQTGRGVLGGGDELLGLMRGFLGAGAASLLLSLWRVEDHSALALTAHVYGALVQGQTKAAALRQAQLKVMQRWSHPYFWAPFMLAGDEGAIPGIAPVPETA